MNIYAHCQIVIRSNEMRYLTGNSFLFTNLNRKLNDFFYLKKQKKKTKKCVLKNNKFITKILGLAYG